jgi:hypothetical protein
MTEETGLSVLDFQAPPWTFNGPAHLCNLDEKTGLCARCGGGLLHRIHLEAAEAEYQKRVAAARKEGRHRAKNTRK